MQPLRISAYTVTSALGAGRRAHLEALLGERSGLRPQAVENCALSTYVGEVAGLDRPVAGELARWDCRNNRLAQFAHWRRTNFALRSKAVAQDSVPGASGCSSARVPPGYSRPNSPTATAIATPISCPTVSCTGTRRTSFSAADFVRTDLGLDGPTLAISTACSSSAKVFASARRAISAGDCDAAVVGGVDSLCLTTLYGFNSLQLVPASRVVRRTLTRNGISIGEAAGFALLEPGRRRADAARLRREQRCPSHVRARSRRARRQRCHARRAAPRQPRPASVDYINLHGTATPANDLAEDRAVREVFGPDVALSSTKGWTGHTLGAAGMVEAAIALLCIEQGSCHAASTRVRRIQPSKAMSCSKPVERR